jgi:uncharacterized membrane protein
MIVRNRWWLLVAVGAVLFFVAVVAGPVAAQEPVAGLPIVTESAPPGPDQFYRGHVLAVTAEEDVDAFGIAGAPSFTQTLQVELLDGPHRGTHLEISYGGLKKEQRLQAGHKVIVLAPNGTTETRNFYIFDRYRLSSLYAILGFFFLLTVVFAQWRGVTSLLGLLISILVLALYVVPRILGGENALVTIITGALIIAATSIYLAHGFNRRTSVALAGTLLATCIAAVLSVVFVSLTRLLGLGSEEALYLQSAPIGEINLRGLLLGGIIIGALGVLDDIDDITTAQAAAVDELAKANPSLSRGELFRRGLSVGREHITSLVNTLVLAYAGTSFPALLLFTVYERPWWVVLNTEVLAEEIVRTLVGSIALMSAVPITTALAAWWLGQRKDVGVVDPDATTAVP